jgi:LysM repeat protein
MKALREMGGGLIIAIVSLLLVIGGISLSLAESTLPEQPTPTPLPPLLATSIDLPTLTPILVVSTNTLEIPIQIPTLAFTVEPSATLAAPAAVCNPPAGWIPILVSASDTLYTLAERYKTTTDALNTSNCLNNTAPAIGSRLYVPPVPTVTVIPCGPFAGWVRAYTVRPGDNLFRISILYRTTVPQLQRANCMGASSTIFVGQVLWVPNVPTSTPAVTALPTRTKTAIPSLTPSLPPPPTATLAPSFTPSLTLPPSYP